MKCFSTNAKSYLDSLVLLLGSVDVDFEVAAAAVAVVFVFDGDCDLDALSEGFDCCCCWPSPDGCWSLSSSRDLKQIQGYCLYEENIMWVS